MFNSGNIASVTFKIKMFFPVIIRKTTKLLKNPFEYTAALCCILIWLKTPAPHQHFYIKHIGEFNKDYLQNASKEVLLTWVHSSDHWVCPAPPCSHTPLPPGTEQKSFWLSWKAWNNCRAIFVCSLLWAQSQPHCK